MVLVSRVDEAGLQVCHQFKGKILNAKQCTVFRSHTSVFISCPFDFLWVGKSMGLGERLDTYRRRQLRSFAWLEFTLLHG